MLIGQKFSILSLNIFDSRSFYGNCILTSQNSGSLGVGNVHIFLGFLLTMVKLPMLNTLDENLLRSQVVKTSRHKEILKLNVDSASL